MEDRWFGNAFQVFEATDENDWKMQWWFYVEERILRRTKKSGSGRAGTYLGMRDER